LKFIIHLSTIYINPMFTVYLIKVVWEFGVETLVFALVFALALIKCCWVAKSKRNSFTKAKLISKIVFNSNFSHNSVQKTSFCICNSIIGPRKFFGWPQFFLNYVDEIECRFFVKYFGEIDPMCSNAKILITKVYVIHSNVCWWILNLGAT